jgi:hypothetical protein
MQDLEVRLSQYPYLMIQNYDPARKEFESFVETKICILIYFIFNYLYPKVAQLKSGRGGEAGAATAAAGNIPEEGDYEVAAASGHQGRVLTGEALMGRVGSLKLYEVLIGLLFISVIISWNPYTLPL